MFHMPKINSRLLELFLTLTAIDGISGAEKEVNCYIQQFLRKLDLQPYEDDTATRVAGNSGNLICRLGSGGDFVLLAHMDTARPTKALQARVQAERITSDQTTILGADNRAGIAALLYNLEKVHREKLPIRDFTVVFTVCEERNIEGSKQLKLDKAIKRGFVLDSSLRPGKFIYSTYGAMGMDIKVMGKAAHSGLHPEEGISAIQTAAKAIAQLNLGKLAEHTTANIGLIKGGDAINVIPPETSMTGEVRALEKEQVIGTVDTIRQTFEQACREMGARLRFSTAWDFEPYKVARESETYQQVIRVLRQVGLAPQPVVSPGGSDANSLNVKGIPTVNLGIGAQNPHSNEEFILLEDLQKNADIVDNLIRKA